MKSECHRTRMTGTNILAHWGVDLNKWLYSFVFKEYAQSRKGGSNPDSLFKNDDES